MKSSEMVPMEDAVESLIRHFVSPLLPRRGVSRQPPSVQQQETVGKQMHAVVVLYNYYQRKQFPKLEVLDFRSFCETACISNPFLLDYMKYMCRSGRNLEDINDQLSITEKMVMNACDICSALDASIDSTEMNEWPISAVAAFLVDVANTKCLLQNGTLVLGSWSLVEKALDTLFKREVNEPDKVDTESILQEAAYSLVEQQMGIKRSNLSILECCSSYSLSKLKSCTQLYIMNYKEHASSAREVSIKDVLSLCGPPVEKSISGMKPRITSTAEHYCLLPYIDILAEWASKQTSQGILVYSSKQKAIFEKSSEDSEVHVSMDNCPKSHRSFLEKEYREDILSKKKRKLENGMNGPSDNVQEYKNDNLIHNSESNCVHSSCMMFEGLKDHVEHEVKDQSLFSNDGNTLEKRQAGFTNQKKDRTSALQHMPAQNGTENCDPLCPVLASDKPDLQVNVLELLKNKRDELCCKQRVLEDFIAQSEMNILTILSEEKPVSQSELLTKAIDFVRSSRTIWDSNSFDEAQFDQNGTRRKSLFDADLQLRSPCQELDEVFRRNCWILPKYCVFPSPENGKFQSLAIARGVDFECTIRGDLKDNPDEARQSAAACLLTKLQDMAAQAHKG